MAFENHGNLLAHFPTCARLRVSSHGLRISELCEVMGVTENTPALSHCNRRPLSFTSMGAAAAHLFVRLNHSKEILFLIWK